ncbi:hypothetical protein PR202_ga31193 [Eleusine coracana subsp. coracana]|uniref:beta-galactosidase n=1 Tax=Eleusine coracana subsp. coracana TaxID=191504 RepID=A0AAV5DRC7_ELECO|nr:hypothetical protein PR202_ga31193 [Eleusine coracana subsp. coracana]
MRFGVAADTMSFYRTSPLEFILVVPDEKAAAAVHNGGCPFRGSSYLLHSRRWSRVVNSDGGVLPAMIDVELKGIPAHAWEPATTHQLLNGYCWIQEVHADTLSRRDMSVFRLKAWCSRQDLLPSEIDLQIVEPRPLASENLPAKRLLSYVVSVAASPAVLPQAEGDPPLPESNQGSGSRRRSRRSPSPSSPSRSSATEDPNGHRIPGHARLGPMPTITHHMAHTIDDVPSDIGVHRDEAVPQHAASETAVATDPLGSTRTVVGAVGAEASAALISTEDEAFPTPPVDLLSTLEDLVAQMKDLVSPLQVNLGAVIEARDDGPSGPSPLGAGPGSPLLVGLLAHELEQSPPAAPSLTTDGAPATATHPAISSPAPAVHVQQPVLGHSLKLSTPAPGLPHGAEQETVAQFSLVQRSPLTSPGALSAAAPGADTGRDDSVLPSSTPTPDEDGDMSAMAATPSAAMLEDLGSHLVGLKGEFSMIYSPEKQECSEWSGMQKDDIQSPFTWYKTMFDAPEGTDPVAIGLGSMGKGQAWVNGRHIGRYWSLVAPESGCPSSCNYAGAYSDSKCRSNCGMPTQSWYHIPREWLQESGNLLVLFEETGGDPYQISLDVHYTKTICSRISENYYPPLSAWSHVANGRASVNTVAPELHLQCDDGHVISKITFASYGTPSGDCQNFSVGKCHASNTQDTVTKACAGKDKCAISVTNDVFGDPCPRVVKDLAVEAECSASSATKELRDNM